MLLKTPRSSLGTPYLPKSATKTMSGLVGWMRIFEIASESREADVRPRLAGVGRLVDAVARLDVAADARLAHPDEDDVGVRLRDGDRADRCAVNLPVRHRRPAVAVVRRLPQAAADGSEVRLVLPALHAGHRDRAAATRGTDAPPLERVEDRRVDRRPRIGTLGGEAEGLLGDRAADDAGGERDE